MVSGIFCRSIRSNPNSTWPRKNLMISSQSSSEARWRETLREVFREQRGVVVA